MSTYGPITVSGTTTFFLPVTTAYSAPPACSSLFLTDEFPTASVRVVSLFAYDAKYAVVAGGGPTCLPTEVSLWWSQASSSQTTAVTHLGGYTMNCPKQYTTQYSYAANTEMTTIGCCPSAYTFAQLLPFGAGIQCYSVIPAGEITYLQPQPNTASTWTTTSSSFKSPYTIMGVQVNGYIVPNPANSASISSTPSASFTPSTSSTTSTSSISNTSSTSLTSTETPGPSSELSSGVKAGIGIAAAVGLIGVLSFLGAWILFRRRQQAYTAPPENSSFENGEGRQKTIQPATFEMGEREHVVELDNHQPALELEAQHRNGNFR